MMKKLRKSVMLFFVGICLVTPSVLGSANQTKKTARADDSSGDFVFDKVVKQGYNGSAYTLNAEDLREMAGVSLPNLLSGLMPGLYTNESIGSLFQGGTTYRIRGNRTPNNGVAIFIDGQERGLNLMSIHEIESITVLKDGAAAAFGMRAANGAILINTRRGKIGAPKIDLTVQLVNQHPLNKLKPFESSQYVAYHNQGRMNDNLDPMYSEWDIKNFQRNSVTDRELYPNVDWLGKLMKKNTWLQHYNINISGGVDKARYFINAGIMYQSGMFNTDNEHSYKTHSNANTYNLRSNVDIDITKTTKLNVDLYGQTGKNGHPGSMAQNAYQTMLTTPAVAFPMWIADHGEYVDQNGNNITSINNKIVPQTNENDNPWAILNRGGYQYIRSVYGSFRLNVTQDLSAITKGLKVSAILSMDSRTESTTVRTRNYAKYEIIDKLGLPPLLKKTGEDDAIVNNVDGKLSVRRTTINANISYDRSFNLHNVSCLLWYEQYENATEVAIPTRYQGVSAWLGYNYDQRYGIDVIMNYQGGYEFSPSERWGLFPSVAVGWTVSNEKFFSGIKNVVSHLKLRASYGKTGNTNGVDAFYYRGRMWERNNVYYTGQSMGTAQNGYLQDIIAYPGLTWEKSDLFNIGVDLRMLSNRLSISADYFRDNRTDSYITNNRINTIAGLDIGSIKNNMGEMHTTGFDGHILWRDRVGEFGYSIGGNFSYHKSKVTQWGDADEDYPYLLTTGYALGVQRGFVADGYFGSWEEIAAAPEHTFSKVQPGDIRYKDVNKDGLIDVHDRVPVGYGALPRITYGITLGANYKGFGFTAIFSGVAKMTRMLDDKVAYPFLNKGNIFKHQTNAWTPENAHNAKFPRLSTVQGSNDNNARNSTLWMQKGDYFKLANLEVYYDFPESLFKKSFLRGVRVFFSGYNLYTWTSCKWIDPQDSPEYSGLPLTRNFSFGCSIKF